MLSEHGFTRKVLPYTPLAKVLLFVIGPDLKSRTKNKIVLNIDMVPTILEMVGVKIPDELRNIFDDPEYAGVVDKLQQEIDNYKKHVLNLK